MLSKALALTSVAALAGQSLALNAHRGLHAEKRAVKVVYETVWATTYVTTDCDEASSAVHNRPSPSVNLVSTPTTVSATSTHTTTSTVSVASSSSSSSSSSQVTSQAPPSSQQTTAQAPSSSAPVVSSPAESSTPVPPTSSAAAPPPQSSTSAAQAPPSSSSSASSASQPAPSAMAVTGRSKRGISYNDAKLANTFASHCPNCQCAYNWGYDSTGLDQNIEFWPMLWSFTDEHTNGWDAGVQAALNRGSTTLLSCNEPDNGGQANLSPAAAASGHAQWMNKYAGKARIASPAITNSQAAGQGTDWLQQFITACNGQSGGCAIDVCTTHWYSPVDQKESLFDHLEKVHQICGGKPVILTEFAPFGTAEEIKAFLQDAVPRLEALSYLDFYAYFMVDTTSLMTDASTLSEYGLTYASS